MLSAVAPPSPISSTLSASSTSSGAGSALVISPCGGITSMLPSPALAGSLAPPTPASTDSGGREEASPLLVTGGCDGSPSPRAARSRSITSCFASSGRIPIGTEPCSWARISLVAACARSRAASSRSASSFLASSGDMPIGAVPWSCESQSAAASWAAEEAACETGFASCFRLCASCFRLFAAAPTRPAVRIATGWVVSFLLVPIQPKGIQRSVDPRFLSVCLDLAWRAHDRPT